MKAFGGWLLAGLAAVGVLLGRPGAAQAQRPNIVFVLVDDLRWDALGCAGHPFVKTPNLDRLAREGALFQNAFVTTPLCSPSRGSFLTGQYVRTHGVKGNGNNTELSRKLVTFPRLLQDAGYETAYVGKWHMGNDPNPRPGFDRWVSFPGQGQHVDPLLNLDGKPEKVTGYMTDVLTGHAVDFLNKERSKPFCLYLAYKAVHGPFVPAERHKGLFADQAITRPPSALDPIVGKPALVRPVGTMRAPAPGGGPGDELVRNQLRMLTAIDEGIGKVVAALDQTRKLDDTLVVFTSDNGYFWGEHGLGDKRWAYEESVRIPLLMRYPRLIPAGARPEGLVLNVDIAPTCLNLAGVASPKGMQGSSLRALFGPEARRWRPSVLLEYFEEPNFPRAPTWEAVRTGRWKYIRYPGLGPDNDELYDLQTDRFEQRNRVADPAAAETLKELRADLERRIQSLAQ
jgi:arylsulfatase A-like enzyme